uniref:Uncharacterized protein n=1 Tax=Panagrellus redivivus TaxID=6233 RepID=A0A7E4VSI7_PANRE
MTVHVKNFPQIKPASVPSGDDAYPRPYVCQREAMNHLQSSAFVPSNRAKTSDCLDALPPSTVDGLSRSVTKPFKQPQPGGWPSQASPAPSA